MNNEPSMNIVEYFEDLDDPRIDRRKLHLLIVPYIRTLVPAVLCIIGVAVILEILFHVRHSAPGDNEMTLFWITFDSHNPVAWAIGAVLALGGFWLARMSAPDLRDAWHRANTLDGGAA